VLHADIGLSVTVIVKTTIGSGIISLPYTMSKLGYVLGTVVLLLFGALNQLCCALLLRSKNLSGHSNYSTIMGYVWQGKKAKFIGSLIIFLDNMGVCSSYIT
jgi:amino acid permease